MNVIRTIVSAAGLAAVPLLASPFVSAPSAQGEPAPRAQGEPGQPPQPGGEYDWRERWPGRRLSESDRLQMTRGLQGLWRMTQLNVPGRFTPTQGEIGYMLVSGVHLSLEVHGGWFDDVETDPSVRGRSGRAILSGLTQTGIHTFEIDEWGYLVTRTLIGTKSTVDGAYEFEPPRTERRYEIDVGGGTAVLRGDDGRTLVFKRMREARSRTDIYGRPVEDEIIEGGPSKTVQRDIYGRPIEPEEPDVPDVPDLPDEEPP